MSSKRQRYVARGLFFATVLVLVGCGGGGGGGSSTPNVSPPAPVPSISLSTTYVSVQAEITDPALATTDIAVTIARASDAPFGLGGRYGNDGLDLVEYLPTSATAGTLRLDFRAPWTLAPATYSDVVTIGFCTDETCDSTRSEGSRQVNVAFTVLPSSNTARPRLVPAQTEVEQTALLGDYSVPAPTRIPVTILDRPSYRYTVLNDSTRNAISPEFRSLDGSYELVINYVPPASLSTGTYTDSIRLRICLDEVCVNEIPDTRVTVVVTYTITDSVAGPNGFTVRRASLNASDVAWDAARNRMYVAIPDNAPANANSISLLDPITLATQQATSMSDDPAVLALSDDAQYLYVGLARSNQVRRIATSTMATDMTIDLGVDTSHSANAMLYARHIQIAPGQPGVLAVSRREALGGNARGIAIYDAGNLRPSIATTALGLGNDIRWADAQTLYAGGYQVSVDEGGASVAELTPGLQTDLIAYHARKLYDTYGTVLDLDTGATQSFAIEGYYEIGMIDPALNRAYFVTNDRASSSTLVEVFALDTLAPLATGKIPSFGGSSYRVRRWGANGLAIVNSVGALTILYGDLVAPQ